MWGQQEARGRGGSAVHLSPATPGHCSGTVGVSGQTHASACTRVGACSGVCMPGRPACEHVPLCVCVSVSCMCSSLGGPTCQSVCVSAGG